MRYLVIACLSLWLSACSYIHGYHPDFQQGNIINVEQLNQLRLGMTKPSVIEMMGEPILQDAFNENRLLYVYTFKTNNGPLIIKQAELTFKNGRLVKIDKNLNYQRSSTKT